MKSLVLWFALVVVVAIAAPLAVSNFRPAAAAMERFVSPGPLSPRHAYLKDQCTSCHESNAGVTVAKCTACHANAQRLLGRQPTAFHASVQECAACHVEHQAENIRPLVMDHVELAKVGVRSLARASATDTESAATLKSLGAWLNIENPNQVNASGTRRILKCAGCHDRKDPHLQRFGSDCAQCHTLVKWTVAGFQHPSSRSTQCVQCHKPPPSHLMGHFAMVSQKIAGKEHARVDECFECHNTTGWNDIVNLGYYKHH